MATFEDLVALTQATEAGKQAGLSNDQAFRQAEQARSQGNIAQYTQQISGRSNQLSSFIPYDRSEFDSAVIEAQHQAIKAAQQKQRLNELIFGSGFADRSEYDTAKANLQAVDRAGTVIDRGETDRVAAEQPAARSKNLSSQIKRLQDEKAARTPIYINGIYMGDSKTVAAEYDKRIAALQEKLRAVEAETPSFMDRLRNTLSGSSKQWGSSQLNAAGTIAGNTDSIGDDLTNQKYEDAVKYRDSLVEDINAARNGTYKISVKGLQNLEEQLDYYNNQLIPSLEKGVESARTLAADSAREADKMSISAAEDLENAKQGLGAGGRLLVDLGAQGTQMALDALTGGTSSLVTRSMGGAMQEARLAGADYKEQLAYGASNAALEVATEKLFDGVAGLYGKGAADDVVNSFIKNATKTDAGARVLKILSGMAGEGAEEAISGLVNPLLQRIYKGEVGEYNIDEITHDILVGALMGGLGSTAGVAVDAARGSADYLPATSPAIAAQDAQNTTGDIQTPPSAQNAAVGDSQELNTQGAIGPADTFTNQGNVGVQENTAPQGAESTQTKQESNEVTSKLRDSIPNLQNDPISATLKGNEFPKGNKKLTEQVGDFFRSFGNRVFRSGLGNVILDERGIKSDIAHGIGRAKSITFAAIPDVIAAGTQIDYQQNWKSRGYDSYIFAAPVKIGDQKTYVAAVVLSDSNNRFYLHEVVDEKGNMIYKINAPTDIKTGVTENDGITGAVEASSEATASDISIPNSPQNVNLREAGNSQNIRTDTAMEPELRESLKQDPLMYEQLSNKETLAKAQAIYNKGFEVANNELREALGKAKAGYKLSPEMIPLAKMVENELVRQGKVGEARTIASDVAAELTYAGQTAQANMILRNADPATQAVAIQKLVDRLSQDLTKGQRKKNTELGRSESGDIVLNSYLVQQYAQETNPEARDVILDEIQQDIADQLPSTFKDKFTALRYLNMLGNMKTNIRNVVGNVDMYLNTKIKNRVRAVAEMTAAASSNGRYKRNTSFWVNSGLKKEARKDADNIMDELRGEAKYSDVGAIANRDIQDKRQIFNNKALEGYRKATNWAMENKYFGDAAFLKLNYTDALAGWMQAHGIKSIAEASPEQLQRGREFAIKEAQEATFRDSNAISDFASNAFRGPNTPNVVKVAGEGIAPFRKTPANVAVRAVEYSPVGLLHTIFYKPFNVKNGKYDAADIINAASKGAVGTSVAIAGFLAGLAGLARGTDDDDELANFQKMQGAMDYSINVNGVNSSLSQFAPQAVPFFMGVEFYEATKDGIASTDDMQKILGCITDPMLEMSMLSGINDTLANLSSSGGDADALPNLFINAGISYLSQGITNTLLGQAEQASEENRQTIYTQPDGILGSSLQYKLGQLSAKIPGIDYNQQDYIDAWGRRQSNGSEWERIINAFINPTYYSKDKSTEVDAELERLYTENKNIEGFPNVLPDKAYRSMEYEKNMRMTADEYQQYSIDRGQMSLELVSDFMDSSQYKVLSDQQRAEIISNLYSLAADRALKKVREANNVKKDSDWDTVASLSDPVSYLSYKQAIGDAAKGEIGVDWSAVDKLMQGFTSLPTDVKDELKSKSDMHLKAIEYATNLGISSKDWYSMYDTIKDAKVTTGSEAQLVAAIAVQKGMANKSDTDKLKMLQSQLPLAKDGDVPTIVRRYDVALQNEIPFDTWTKFEAALKDSGSTNKWAIRKAAQEAGVNPDTAVKIYKSLYADEKYTAQVNEEFLTLNPPDDKGNVEPVKFMDYLNGTTASPASTKVGQDWLMDTSSQTRVITDWSMLDENLYQKLIRQAKIG